jgi:hypothetical protein
VRRPVRQAARALGAVTAALSCMLTAGFLAAPGAAAPGPHTPVRAEARAPAPPRRPPLRIESLAPARLQPGTPVQVSGTVLNTTRDVWGDAQVGMLASSAPLTTLPDLARATRADPDDFPGSKILTTGTFDDIGDVAPGQSRSFSFTVPYEELGLSGDQGAYWVGAEVRVTDGQGFRGAVARDLTFMPLLAQPASAPDVELAMLWPLTGEVPWNGRAFATASLLRDVSPDGRLRTLAELGASAGRAPLTWVLDPAVLDGARRLSGGATVAGRELPGDSAEAQAAAEWLALLRRPLATSVAFALPYAHPDVAAIAHRDLKAVTRKSHRAADRVLDALGVARLDALWPAGGWADRRILSLARGSDAEVALLARDTFARRPAGSVVDVPVPVTDEAKGQPLRRPAVVTDPERSKRGLRAQPGQSVLQWRQAILANTALRSLSADQPRRTAVAMPSSGWWPDSAWRDARLFAALQVPWVERVTAASLVDEAGAPAYDGRFRYPRQARRRELGEPILTLVQELRRTARTLTNLVADPAAQRAESNRALGLATSVAWRNDRATGQEVAETLLAENREDLRSIDLEAPEAVTLSSTSGRFPVSLTNGMDQAATVGLTVDPENPGINVADIAPVTLQPDQRVTITVVTNAQGVGSTDMTVRMITQQGTPFGLGAVVDVRTTQIGALMWVVMGIGGAVLFVAAGRRIRQRLREGRPRTRGAR